MYWNVLRSWQCWEESFFTFTYIPLSSILRSDSHNSLVIGRTGQTLWRYQYDTLLYGSINTKWEDTATNPLERGYSLRDHSRLKTSAKNKDTFPIVICRHFLKSLQALKRLNRERPRYGQEYVKNIANLCPSLSRAGK